MEKEIPLTVLRPPTTQAGDYTETLAQWGALPEVLPLPDVARFIGHRCKQNPAAILKMLEQAVVNAEIPYRGLTSAGTWEADFIRYLHPAKSVSALIKNADGTERDVIELERGRLHSEAMGVAVADAVKLLAKRGRKIPEELQDLLPAVEVVDTASEAGDGGQAAISHKLKNRTHALDAEIQEARGRAMDGNDPNSVWAELIKMAEKKQGLLIGYSSDGLQYKGKTYQDSEVPDVFTRKALGDRMRRAKKR
jgi:hypothetical protein